MPQQNNLEQRKAACTTLVFRPAGVAPSILFALSVMIPGSQVAANSLPPGLPAHFAFGLKSASNNQSWMPNSGVPWNYRYQYLNLGWDNKWGINGSFAANYIDWSLDHNYIPVLDYYWLGSHDDQCAGWDKMKSCLASVTFMSSYFSNFQLLMQKAGAFGAQGRRVIVHIEPDMWSQMQQHGSSDPTTISVAVNKTGHSLISNLPNNAAGFAQALKAFRDHYAPNVLLALDNAPWAVNYDVTCYYGCGNPPSYYGNKVAGFYKKLGAQFDLVFYNTSDADAAYNVLVRGWPSGVSWWTDTAFNNLRQYIAAIYQATGMRGMLWQTPAGNTYYRSVNNTPHHYQDNRPQYFLDAGNRQHIVDYANAGVIGVLLGDGQHTDTSYWDLAGDGITNPAPINGNTLIATSPNDDGGYLKINAAAYYSSRSVPLP